MNFEKRFKVKSVAREFEIFCKDNNLTLTQMWETLEENEDVIREEGNRYALMTAKEWIATHTQCPVCYNENLLCSEGKKYCPMCIND